MPEELIVGNELEGKTLLLVDGSSYLYRAYHAMPDLRGPDGGPTGALYGIINMLRRMRKEVTAEYSACVFDAKGKTFRDDWYAEYKANRPSMPDDLAKQIEPIHVAVRALGWPLLMIEGVEADDVIGTLSKAAEKRGMTVIVSTGDKDLAQLVTDHVALINTMTNETLDGAGVLAKFGVPPERIVDYLSLIGDTVDNVPGVEKCGPKTAIKWLTQYGTLDDIVAHADEIKGAVGDNLRRALDFLPLAKKLVTVDTNCDLTQHVASIEETLATRDESRNELRDVFARHGFKTWLREVEVADVVEGPQTDVPPAPTIDGGHQYDTVQTWEQFDTWLAKLDAADITAFDTETTSLDPMTAQLVGLSISVEAGRAAYIPVAHRGPDAPVQLPRDEVLAKLKPWLESADKKKVGQHLKYDEQVLANYGIEMNGIEHDTLLQSYVLESHRTHDMDSLALRHLGLKTIKYEDVAGKGAAQIGFDEVALARAAEYAAEDADITLRLHQVLYPQIAAERGLEHVYRDIEIPTSRVLRKMERTGVLIDAEIDLHRQAAAHGECADRSRAYELCAGCGRHGTSCIERSESPEHSRSHGGRPAHSRGVYRAAWPQARVSGLFADRIAHHGAHLRRRIPVARVRAGGRYSPGDCRGGVWRHPPRGIERSAAYRQGHQLRPDLRDEFVRSRVEPRDHARCGQALHRPLFPALSGRRALHGRNAHEREGEGLRRNRIWTASVAA